MGERIRPGLGLQLCMAVALVLEAAVTVALAAGLVWVTLFADRGYVVAFAVAILALLGAVAATDTGRRRRHRGRDVKTRDRERVRRIAERLCVVGDIAEPRVAVRENPLPESWTVAVPWATPRIFVTTGLLDLLDDRKLEAVVAHELSHIAHHDALVMTIAALPGDWVLRGLRYTFRQERRDDPFRAYASIPAGVLFAIPALPFALLARVLSRLRERAADAGAARLTGSPAAVAAALVALSEHVADRRPVDLRAAAPAVLNILPLRPANGIARLWATHPPLEARLAALTRMEARLQRPAADGAA
jgi:heat shock protein HtpX